MAAIAPVTPARPTVSSFPRSTRKEKPFTSKGMAFSASFAAASMSFPNASAILSTLFPSLPLLICLDNSSTLPCATSIDFFNGFSNFEYAAIPTFFREFTTLADFSLKVSVTLSYASPTTSVFVFIASRLLVNVIALSPAIDKAAFPASRDPNISISDLSFSFAYPSISTMISTRVTPSSINSLKDFLPYPMPSYMSIIALLACVPFLPSSAIN